MKKVSVFLVILSFFAFVSLNSCQQKPKTNQTEEEMTPAGNDTTPGMQQDTTKSADTTMQK